MIKGLSVVMVNSELAETIVGQGVSKPGAAKRTIDEVIPSCNPMLQRPSVPQG